MLFNQHDKDKRELKEQIRRLNAEVAQSTELLELAQIEIDKLHDRDIPTHTIETPQQWHLKVDETTTYGPVTLIELYDWAAQGRISPDDMISDDELNWRQAASMPELGMEWKTKLANGTPCGPLNLFGIAELVSDGGIPPSASVINIRTGKKISASSLASPEMKEARSELDRMRRDMLQDDTTTSVSAQENEGHLDDDLLLPPPKTVRARVREHRRPRASGEKRSWAR